jgi:hypothetical protein
MDRSRRSESSFYLAGQELLLGGNAFLEAFFARVAAIVDLEVCGALSVFDSLACPSTLPPKRTECTHMLSG